MKLRNDCDQIVRRAIAAVQPDAAVRRALEGNPFQGGRVVLVAVGKAAWSMARAACDCVGGRLDGGIVITKHGHSEGPIGNLEVWEAGHPVPDDGTFAATSRALELTQDLKPEDRVLFLLSGGGSALFEKPRISKKELSDITEQLLASGADIVEMNTIRKRLSEVKGGRFALACMPAMVETVVLSDIVGDPMDMIASGPAYPDASTCEDAGKIAKKYKLRLSAAAEKCLADETPKELHNVHTQIIGSVRQLCKAAQKACKELGYEPRILAEDVTAEAREVGWNLAQLCLREHDDAGEKKMALIAGGETVVHLRGKGKGGRNQELAFSAMKVIAGQQNMAIFSVGSDGTDGPTDAAGGYVDGDSYEALKNAGLSYEKIDGLVMTGPTGTNVNDFWVALIG